MTGSSPSDTISNPGGFWRRVISLALRTGLICTAAAAAAQLATHLLAGGAPAWLAGIAGLQVVMLIGATWGPLRLLGAIGEATPPPPAFAAVARLPARLLAAATAGALAGCLTLLVSGDAAGLVAVSALAFSFLAALLCFYVLSAHLLRPVSRRLAVHGPVEGGHATVRLKLFATIACVALCTFVVGQAIGERATLAGHAPLVGALIVLLGIAALSALAVRDLLLEVAEVRYVAQRLARADLREPHPVPTTEEFGRLGTSLRAVANALGQIVVDLADLGRAAEGWLYLGLQSAHVDQSLDCF